MLRSLRGCFFIFLLWLIAWPILQLLIGALEEKGFRAAISQIASETVSPTTLSTGALALSVAFCSTVLGVTTGWLLAFWPPRSQTLVNMSLITPLVLPSYVLGIAWTHVLGSWIYSFGGCVFVLTGCWFPLIALLSRRAFRDLDWEIRASAMLEGAGTRQLFWKIDLPLVVPVLVTGFLLVFIFALIEFGVPSLLLVHVSSFEVFTHYSAFYDPSGASLSGVPILVVAILALIAERLIRRGEPIRFLADDREGQAIRTSRSASRWIGFLMAGAPALLPMGVLVIQASSSGDPSGMRIAWSLARDVILPSLWISFASGIVLTGIGGILAILVDNRLMGRRDARYMIFCEAAIMLLLAIPPALWSLALLRQWNHPGFFHEWITDSTLILLIGYLGHFLPVTYRIVRDAVEAVPTELLESARLDGAGPGHIAGQILWPLSKSALLIAACIGFILSFGELNVTLFCAAPVVATAPTGLYTIMANSPTQVVACVCLILTGTCFSAVLLALAPKWWFTLSRPDPSSQVR